jgi:hypothetical protein
LQPADLAGGDVLGATDLLGSIVQERIEGAKRRRPQDHKKPEAEQRKEDEQKALERISEALSTPGGIDNMVDQVVIRSVIEPRLEKAPLEFSERVEGIIYIDTVPFQDKMAIFNWAMKGIDDLKGFRQSSAADVEGVEPREDVPVSSE